jgi:hypothetical protein
VQKRRSTASTSSAASGHKDCVSVAVNGKRSTPQGEGFVLCPLGLQFFSPKAVAEFTVMDFELTGSQTKSGQPLACQGVVVRCERQAGKARYKVWIKFLEMPAATREEIRCTAKKGRHICAYCENF